MDRGLSDDDSGLLNPTVPTNAPIVLNAESDEEKTIMEHAFKRRKTVNRQTELDEYMQLRAVDHAADPLQWWKGSTGTFPTLSRVARDYLCIPGTST